MKRSTATKRFTPEAVEQAVMDYATNLIAEGRPRQEVQTIMVAGFMTAQVLRELDQPEPVVLVATAVLT